MSVTEYQKSKREEGPSHWREEKRRMPRAGKRLARKHFVVLSQWWQEDRMCGEDYSWLWGGRKDRIPPGSLKTQLFPSHSIHLFYKTRKSSIPISCYHAHVLVGGTHEMKSSAEGGKAMASHYVSAHYREQKGRDTFYLLGSK